MAYYRPRKPKQDASEPIQFPGPVDISKNIWDTIKAPLSGFWQGFAGKNLTFDQYMNEKARKRRGLSPRSYPGKRPLNWLQRTIRGK